jgi:ankyrin repeat protein
MICLQKHRSDHKPQCLLIQEEKAKKEAKARKRAEVLEVLGEELYKASFVGKEARMGRLLKLGIDVNFVVTKEGPVKGAYPLLAAAQEAHVEVVRLLLAAQAQVNQVKDGGWSACHTAALEGHVQVLEMLLEAGADVHLKSDNGCTALDLAILCKHPAVEAVLLAHIANLEAADVALGLH